MMMKIDLSTEMHYLYNNNSNTNTKENALAETKKEGSLKRPLSREYITLLPYFSHSLIFMYYAESPSPSSDDGKEDQTKKQKNRR